MGPRDEETREMKVDDRTDWRVFVSSMGSGADLLVKAAVIIVVAVLAFKVLTMESCGAGYDPTTVRCPNGTKVSVGDGLLDPDDKWEPTPEEIKEVCTAAPGVKHERSR